MGYLGLIDEYFYYEYEYAPTIWLRSAKLPPGGEGLADKWFEFVDKFSHGSTGWDALRMLRSRKVK